MKRLMMIGLLAAMAVMLAGCGTIVVEDAEPVRIGAVHIEYFT